MNLRLIGFFLLTIVFQNANAQFEFLPLSNESENTYNHQLFSKSTDFHSSVKPYRKSEVNEITNREIKLQELNGRISLSSGLDLYIFFRFNCLV